MTALDIWYDRIELKRLIDAVPDEEKRARIEKKLEKARGRTVAAHDFPKLAEHIGTTPRIKDNPPLIFHSEMTGDADSAEIKAAWRATTTPCPSTSACSSTAFICATSR